MPVSAKAPRGVIDAIYWKLHTSYLRNDRKTADRFLAMLEHEADGDWDAVRAELGLKHFLRLHQIKAKIKIGQYGRLYGDGYETPAIEATYGVIQKSGLEREFCDKLYSQDGRERLAVACGFGPVCTVLRELDLDEFGRVDFLLGEGRARLAVEVKMGEAPSSVVSQIDKYRLGLELDMCRGLYDEVFAAVAAEYFPPYVATELSRLSVIMLQHNGTIESVRRLK